jgi:uncharacterized membrane protein YciS (DUF1049 family)
MRVISLVLLVVIVGAAVAFALQNEGEVTITFLTYKLTTTIALLAGVAFGAGMLGGWSIIGLLRRSWARVTEPEYRRASPAR